MIELNERLRTHPVTDEFYERNRRTEPFDREAREADHDLGHPVGPQAREALDEAIEKASAAYLKTIEPHQNRLDAAKAKAAFMASMEDL